MDENLATQSSLDKTHLNLWVRILGLSLILGVYLIYFPINQHVNGGFSSHIFLDDWIPLWPVWTAPYILAIGWWVFAAIWAAIKMELALFKRLVAAVLVMSLSSFLVHLLIPTFVVRPEAVGEGWGMNLIRMIYALDQPYNALPSGHTYNTVLVAIFWWHWKPRYRWLWAATVPVVILSTLFTKQHYLLDPLFGLLWAFGAYFISGKLMAWRSKRAKNAEVFIASHLGWRILWVVMILFMLALGFMYSSLPVDGATGDLNSFAPEGFRVQWVIDQRPDSLQVDDVIVRAGGYTVDEWLNGVAVRGPEWDQGAVVQYEILREGRPLELAVEMGPLPLRAILNHWGIQFVGILSIMAIGSFVFWKLPDDPAARWFMLFCMMIAAQMVGDGWNFQFALLTRPAYFWIHLLNEHLTYSMIFVAALMETLSFPTPYPIAKKYSPWVSSALTLIILGLTYGTVFLVSPMSLALNLSNRMIVLVSAIFLLEAMGILIYTFRNAKDPIDREKIKWALYIVVVIAFVGIPFYYLPLILQGQPTLNHPLVSAMLLIGLPSAFAIAILGVRLYDIDFIINRSLVYGFLSYLLLGIFTAILYIINRVATVLTGGQQSMAAIALSAALFGALFQPTRRAIQRFVDRRFYHIGIDYEKVSKIQREIKRGPINVVHGRQMVPFGDLEFIGSGGMAMVYKSYHPGLNRTVAVKLLPPHLSSPSLFQARFEREAQTIASLKHPNIVQLFDYGEENRTPYMVMEYIEGETLSHYLQGKKALPLVEVQPLVASLANALDYAHDQGMVHRDIKPSNIMLEPTPGSPESPFRVVLMDFGVAKLISGETTRLTFTGVLGSFDYIAPEQIEASGEVDRRADIYSLGVMVYQMLAGELPFKHNNPGALLIAHMQQQPPDPREFNPDLPEEIVSTLLRALEKDPARRHPTAGEFAEALRIP